MVNSCLLEVENLSCSFGGIQALDSVSIDILDREILAIIGPNGAGKTTLINCINGFYRAQKGRITFSGKIISRLASYKIAELGIGRTFQHIQLYFGMSTLDNLMTGRHTHLQYGSLSAAYYFGKAHRQEIEHRKYVEGIIDLLELQSVRHKVVGSLPYGIRKKIDLGRALALDPKLLLLDEPMSGMNLEEKEDMARFILDIRDLKRIPIVIIEHDMEVVMDLSDRVIVLDFGHKIADGIPSEIMGNEAVIKAYLGE